MDESVGPTSIDPTPLNKALLRKQYCMAIIDDVLPQLSSARCFSSCDLLDGLWYPRLDLASSRLMTFEIPFGRRHWLRLPFGIPPSPEIFKSRVLDDVQIINFIIIITI